MNHGEIKATIDGAWKTMTDRGIFPMPHMAYCLGSLKVGNKVLVISDNEIRIDTIDRQLYPTTDEAIEAFISQVSTEEEDKDELL